MCLKKQILVVTEEGKHMMKSIKSFTILYLTLYKLYIAHFFFTTDEVFKKNLLNDSVQNIGLNDKFQWT